MMVKSDKKHLYYRWKHGLGQILDLLSYNSDFMLSFTWSWSEINPHWMSYHRERD